MWPQIATEEIRWPQFDWPWLNFSALAVKVYHYLYRPYFSCPLYAVYTSTFMEVCHSVHEAMHTIASSASWSRWLIIWRLAEDFPPLPLPVKDKSHQRAQVRGCMTIITADEAPRRDGILGFIRYFQDISRAANKRPGTHPRAFPSHPWNVYERVEQDLCVLRTLEGWHLPKSPGAARIASVGYKIAKGAAQSINQQRAASRIEERSTSRGK